MVGTAMAASAIASLAASGLSHLANKGNLNASNAYNQQMYEKEWQKQQEWYDKNSSPLALRQAYEKAGFSPYAMLGNSGPSIPSVGAPTSEPLHDDFDKDIGNKSIAAAFNQQNLENLKVNGDYVKQQIEGQKIANQSALLQYEYNKSYLYGDKMFDKISKLFGTWDKDKFASILDSFDSPLQVGPNDYKFVPNSGTYDNYISRKRSLELENLNETFKNAIKSGKLTDAKTDAQLLENSINDFSQYGKVAQNFLPVLKFLLSIFK